AEITPQPVDFYDGEGDRRGRGPRAASTRRVTREAIVVEEPGEAATLLELVDAVRRFDPDVVLTRGGDGMWFPYLLSRASVHGITRELGLSRSSRPLARCKFQAGGGDHYFSYGAIVRRSPTQFYLRGRLHVDTTTHGGLHFRDGNVPGLVEVARVSRVPLQRLARVTIGGALQSIQFHNAYQRGILVPPVKLNTEEFKSASNLLRTDKGGHFFEPMVGVFDDVAELDFDSMYPTLMRVYNVSPETVNCKCCAGDPARHVVPEVGFHTCARREGIVPASLRVPLTKRLAYKRLARAGGPGSRRYEWMQAALKWILVVSFGYLGFRNARFGRVEAHQAVCAYSREFLLRSAEVARRHGFRVIHGLVDSLYIQRDPASAPSGTSRQVDAVRRFDPEFDAECLEICEEIHGETKLSMSYDGRFKFIVFMPSRASRAVPTLNHYWGVKTDGEIKARGIEVRRRDTPAIVKAAQWNLMRLFAKADDRAGFLKLLPAAGRLVEDYRRRIESGDVDPRELLVTTRVSRTPDRYKVNSHQAVAARQLQRMGVHVGPGQKIQYVIADAAAKLPGQRVVAGEALDRRQVRFDAAKYIELVERAYQNLVPFDLGAKRRRGLRRTHGLARWIAH
ncbi:MAG: DNA polymerase domain-containing protein, partial [Promethearchaeota archaeon]